MIKQEGSAADEFKRLSIEESLKRLGTNLATGLTAEEAKKENS